MVQTEDQYKFCHDAVLEYVLCGDTSVSAANLQIHINKKSKIDSETGKTGFEKDLEIINRLSPGAEKFSYSGSKDDANAKKNRYADCVPPDDIRVYLRPVPGQPADSSYINAAIVDGYQRPKMYITTQGPLKETVGDFWRLVWDYKCQIVVMVTQLKENGKEMSVQYWPSDGTAEYAMMSVAMETEKKLEGYTVRKFLINKNDRKANDQRTITQFQYLDWPDDQLSGNVSQLLTMINELEREQTKAENKSVIVMCSDGVHRCGIFCAVSIIIEAMKTEQIVDVFQVVRSLRLQNPFFLNSLEDYKFCYKVAQQFLDSFHTYANFKAL
jgi:protein tyrosine phosphatase